MNRKKYNKPQVYITYTLGFILLIGIILIIFSLNGLSTVYNADALLQHYPTQFYIRDLFYSFFRNISSGIERFNFNIGLGQDVMTTYHYYGITDPLNLLLGVSKRIDPEALYTSILVLRMYLSGLSFIFLCLYFEKGKRATVVGSLIYVFSNFTLAAGMMHPYFINSMILLPLMIIGVHRLITKNKAVFFILMSALSLVVNFYFAYMIAIITFVYAIILIIGEVRTNGGRKSITIFLRGIVAYIISILISGIVLIPVAYGYINSYRNIDSKVQIPLLIEKSDAISYFVNLFRFPHSDNFALLGISIAVILTLICLFINRGNIRLKILFILMLLLISIPKLQSALNGFSYANFRWNYAVILLLSYIFVSQFDELINLAKSKKILVSIITVLYLTAYSYFMFKDMKINISAIVNMNFLTNILPVIIAIILIVLLFVVNEKSKKNTVLLVVFLALSANIVFYARNAVNNESLVKNEKLIALRNDQGIEYLADKTKNSFDRVDNSNPEMVNMSDVYGYPTISEYYSLENKYYSLFNLEIKNSKASPVTKVNSFDNRAILNSILSVKYYVGDTKIPFGFANTDVKGIYINKNFIPFGFTYDKYIESSKIRTLSELDKQELMLDSCITEEKIDGVKEETHEIMREFDLRRSTIEYKIEKENSTRYKLEADVPYNGELYMRIKDVDTFKNNETIFLKVGDNNTTLNFTKTDSNWYSGEKEVVVNLGYTEKGKKKIRLNLSKEGSFNQKNISLECRPVSDVERASKMLSENHLRDMLIYKDGFEGMIDVSSNKLLFISIPYSDGWTASVDGKETKIYRANTGFMAINLKKGSHKIKFHYNRPFQLIGTTVSAIGIIIFITYLILRRRRGENSGRHKNFSKK